MSFVFTIGGAFTGSEEGNDWMNFKVKKRLFVHECGSVHATS